MLAQILALRYVEATGSGGHARDAEGLVSEGAEQRDTGFEQLPDCEAPMQVADMELGPVDRDLVGAVGVRGLPRQYSGSSTAASSADPSEAKRS